MINNKLEMTLKQRLALYRIIREQQAKGIKPEPWRFRSHLDITETLRKADPGYLVGKK